MIQSIGNVLILNIKSNAITVLLSIAFYLSYNMFNTEINLHKHTANTSKGEKNKCSEWINWITKFNNGRETIYSNVKALKTFMIISVTSCSCVRAFSKLSIVKSICYGAVLWHWITWMACSQYSLNKNLLIMWTFTV